MSFLISLVFFSGWGGVSFYGVGGWVHSFEHSWWEFDQWPTSPTPVSWKEGFTVWPSKLGSVDTGTARLAWGMGPSREQPKWRFFLHNTKVPWFAGNKSRLHARLVQPANLIESPVVLSTADYTRMPMYNTWLRRARLPLPHHGWGQSEDVSLLGVVLLSGL